ncbi:alpha/beta hydrolase [Pseudorhodoferax sp.]|uniref:alpha/beta hydrolase n=1 Tax=Pseudorhodoferax sp. TaxID=1993553 RepID=UPI0039E3CF28
MAGHPGVTRRAMGACGLGFGLGLVRPAASAAPTGLQDTGHAVALAGTREFGLRSAAGRDYRILVARPPGEAPPQGYGVLLVLDGNAYFGVAAQAMRMLARFPGIGAAAGPPAPLLVVGVGDPGDAELDGARRTWDFLPVPREGPAHAQRAQLGAEPGGADAFLDFLVQTLRPALAARYPLRPDGHTLAGHSLGGYFALHALARSPLAFQRYAAISPSLWWDGQRLVADMAQSRPGPGRARVLLAVARDELPGFPERTAAMLDGARRMRGVLAGRGLPPEALQYLEMEREDHLTMPFALMPAVVRFAAAP